MDLSLSKKYYSIDELKKEASDIVEIKAISSETIEYEDMTFTLSKVKILDSIISKCNLKKSDEITIIETGGIVKLPEKQAKKVGSKKINLAVDGISVLQTGEKNIIFLQRFIGPQVKDAFVPLGVYQGKFRK